MKYTKNLHIEGDRVISYTTHVATIDREARKLYVHGYWSQTTSKHINHVADVYGLTKEERPTGSPREDSGHLRTVAMIAKLGDVLTNDPKQANDWKTRMLKAGLENSGLIMPEDWPELPEEEKTRRLDAAIAELMPAPSHDKCADCFAEAPHGQPIRHIRPSCNE